MRRSERERERVLEIKSVHICFGCKINFSYYFLFVNKQQKNNNNEKKPFKNIYKVLNKNKK
jgi:hypothetical protein